MVAVLESTTVDSASVRWSPNTGLASSFQIQISLFGPISSHWRFRQPLLITIEQGSELFIASDDLFGMYGVGNDIVSAVKDYISAILEYYELLSSHRDEPSIRLFRHLQNYLQPTRR
jgi:hypothetical protein